MNVEYRIIELEDEPGIFRLESIVDTNYNGDAVNWIVEGSREACERALDRIVLHNLKNSA